MSTEEWRDMVGWEGVYQVSNQGRVMRVAAGKGTLPGRILKNHVNADGYIYVSLCHKERHRHERVHRLVAAAFLKELPNGREVNHKNLDKQDNRPGNLEYVTHQQNMQHAMHHKGPFTAKHGEDNNSAKLTRAQADEIRRLYSSGHYSMRQLAKRFNISKSTIAQIVNRRIWR